MKRHISHKNGFLILCAFCAFLWLVFFALESSSPAIDFVHRGFVNLFLWQTKFLRRFERMIAAFDGIYLRGRSKIFDEGLNLFRCAERVASALNKQHRFPNV